MTHIWNIYESGDPYEPSPDPFDIFVYTVRREQEPFINDVLFVEGECKRIFAVERDYRREENLGLPGECYWKVCVK
ncbi:MAG: hypothetical protein Q4B58_05045 [Bacteroidales bacterium]|nr:hypothetical protein [Bacteroidales bacterium]